jgi:hypothetical protein
MRQRCAEEGRFLWSFTFFSVLVTAASGFRTAWSQEPAFGGREPGVQAPQSDQDKIKGLEDRCKSLRGKIGEWDGEYKRVSTAIADTDKGPRAADPVDREVREAERKDLGIMLVRAIYEREKAYDTLASVDDRLRKLKQLVRLDTEIASLGAQEKEQSKILAQLDSDWGSRRSEMVKSLLSSRLADELLDLRMHPENAVGEVTKERAKRIGRDINKSFHAEHPADTKGVTQIADNNKRKKDAAWAEGRRLQDRAVSARMKIVEIQASIQLATWKKNAIEAGRDEWDRD